MDSHARSAVEQDLLNHYIEEQEVGAGIDVNDDELQDYANFIQNISDEELTQQWFGSVGEWIEPMKRWVEDNEYYVNDEMPEWEVKGFDSIAEWQFTKLTTTYDIDYAYNQFMFTHPYNDEYTL